MVTIQQLIHAVNVLQLKILAEKAGVNYQVLRRKIQSGKQLDIDESKKLYEALQEFGITLNQDQDAETD